MENFNLKDFFQDMKALRLFKKDVKSELKNPQSKMNRFRIKKNTLGNILYVQINCTEKDFVESGYDYDTMVSLKIEPIVKYLSRELNWGDYLIPQVSNFVDDEGNPSLSYGVLFIFNGYSLTMTRFIWFVLINLGLIGGAIWAVLKYLV